VAAAEAADAVLAVSSGALRAAAVPPRKSERREGALDIVDVLPETVVFEARGHGW
jgi:hypothetical protein